MARICSPQDELYEELWLACAGSLPSIAHSGDKVYYFPQGHMEQVSASTSQATDQALPPYDLSPQFLCRVVGVQLSAELDTDEVFAQLSLIPEAEGLIPASDLETAASMSKRPQVHMFSKTLTASDTSTHGGFSIHRKAAEECLPPLDMTMNPPAQELVAKDLHGQEWHFRHIYRGHPKRHLLTTGWSVFVSQKRLVAGDVVIFLRGEDGEIRVGIRRAARPLLNQPSSLLSNHSMCMGVVATAWHAIATRTMFSVIFKPRVSPAEFIVPVEKYNKALKSSPCVGMRCTMSLELENVQDRRCSGTITGIGALDPQRWRGSHWRSIKVSWDDQTVRGLQYRVSPWEIELCTNSTTPAANNKPLGGTRNKRFRGNTQCTSASAADLKGLTGEEAEKSQIWQGGSTDCEDVTGECLRGGDGRKASSGRQDSMASSVVCSFSNKSGTQEIKQFLQERSGSTTVEDTNGGLSQNPPAESERKLYVSGTLKQRDVLLSSYRAACDASSTDHTEPSQEWFKSLVSSSPLNPFGHGNLANQPSFDHQNKLDSFPSWEQMPKQEAFFAPLSTENSCKLFGISLMNIASHASTSMCPTMPSNLSDEVKRTIEEPRVVSHSIVREEIDHAQEQSSKLNKPDDTSASSDQVRPAQKFPNDGRFQKLGTARSCTKVIKKGCMLGRVLDLSRLSGYGSLFEELEKMFHMEGELKNQIVWKVAYRDNEGDMLLVGDDPWQEFCDLAQKIIILSSEEAQGAGLLQTKLPQSLSGEEAI